MSTIRFETSPKASPVQGSPLDDYYPSLLIDMDAQNISTGYSDNHISEHDDNPNDDDLYAQLAQKDQDLILAAEIGKSLLEKNEELTKANEKLTEDYSQKIEVRTNTFVSLPTAIPTPLAIPNPSQVLVQDLCKGGPNEILPTSRSEHFGPQNLGSGGGPLPPSPDLCTNPPPPLTVPTNPPTPTPRAFFD